MRRGGSSARGLVLAGLVALACSGCGGDWVPSEMDEPIERAVEAVKADELAQFQLLQEQYTDGVDEAEMVEILARYPVASEHFSVDEWEERYR